MGVSTLKPGPSQALTLEAQARKQGMIYEEECRVNWASSSLNGDATEEEYQDKEE